MNTALDFRVSGHKLEYKYGYFLSWLCLQCSHFSTCSVHSTSMSSKCPVYVFVGVQMVRPFLSRPECLWYFFPLHMTCTCCMCTCMKHASWANPGCRNIWNICSTITPHTVVHCYQLAITGHARIKSMN